MVFLATIIGSELSIPILIISQVVLGIALGFFFAFSIGKLLKNLQIGTDGLYAVFMAAAMFITFSATDLLQGNGYLTLYILGIYLQYGIYGKRDIVSSLTVLPRYADWFVFHPRPFVRLLKFR